MTAVTNQERHLKNAARPNQVPYLGKTSNFWENFGKRLDNEHAFGYTKVRKNVLKLFTSLWSSHHGPTHIQ